MTTHTSEQTHSPIRILYLDADQETRTAFCRHFGSVLKITAFDSEEKGLYWLRSENEPDVIVIDEQLNGLAFLRKLRSETVYQAMPIILVADVISPQLKEQAMAARADDVFEKTVGEGNLQARIEYLVKRRELLKNRKKEGIVNVKISPIKRLFDMAVSLSALFMLSPLLLLVATLIKLDSKGPVLYLSKRVGRGYKIFGLFKFRTMKTGADAMIKDMASLNLYNKPADAAKPAAEKCEKCTFENKDCDTMLYIDGKVVCEKLHLRSKKEEVAFVKFQNDPRITWLGAFLRNSSIDELPQLLNILLGDMSLVGNRPLPLYEAEKLTTDESMLRFAAPAGLTGLWQVTKRGKKDVSEQERIRLDIEYSQKHSFLFDIKIMLKTFPALLQKENV